MNTLPSDQEILQVVCRGPVKLVDIQHALTCKDGCAIYSIVNRLVSNRLIKIHYQEPLPDAGGCRRKAYLLTGKGMKEMKRRRLKNER